MLCRARADADTADSVVLRITLYLVVFLATVGLGGGWTVGALGLIPGVDAWPPLYGAVAHVAPALPTPTVRPTPDPAPRGTPTPARRTARP